MLRHEESLFKKIKGLTWLKNEEEICIKMGS